jgi:hypothetical protein
VYVDRWACGDFSLSGNELAWANEYRLQRSFPEMSGHVAVFGPSSHQAPPQRSPIPTSDTFAANSHVSDRENPERYHISGF